MNQTEPSMHARLTEWLAGVRDLPVEDVIKDLWFMYEIDLGNGIKTKDRLAKRSPNHVANTQLKFDTVLQMLDSVYPDGLTGKTALDIACNCGLYSFALADRSLKWGLGLDHAPGFIQQAIYLQHVKSRTDDRYGSLDFRVGDVLDVSFPPDTFNITLCLGFLYHVTDLLGMCRKLSEWTLETLFIQTIVTSDDAPLARLGDPTIHEFIDKTEFSLIPSLSLVIACLKEAGFSSVEEWQSTNPTGVSLPGSGTCDTVFLIARKPVA